MKINVSGRHMEVGDALRAHIEKRVDDGVHKYMDRVTSLNVVVSKEKNAFTVDIIGNIGTHAGFVVKASARGDDVYATFDVSEAKMEKQLRRYKRRLTNHHTDKIGLPQAQATVLRGVKYVIADNEEEPQDAPLVIAEKSTDIESLTVSEAVMRMDLSDLPALMFINVAHGRMNIVYRRADGNISWVDPSEQSKAA
ncbi:MAG: ribosome-associated translation inhibitor RaiA [Rickettsiales bacterium]|nr:ribosome-associated translation inhibitor RaiA [Rickettsiales bacterium]